MSVYLNGVAPVNPFRFETEATRKSGSRRNNFSGVRGEIPGSARGSYFCFTAIAEISMRALLTKAAAWIVARAGLGSGMTPL
jgi:hypothetical protein